MLAKFGLVSPFNKRRVLKEPPTALNTPETKPPLSNMLHGQLNPATPAVASNLPTPSGIPAMKRSGIPAASGLPVFSTPKKSQQQLPQPKQVIYSHNQSQQSLSSQLSANETRSSGLMYKSVSNKTSRSGSPSETESSTAMSVKSTSTSRSNISTPMKSALAKPTTTTTTRVTQIDSQTLTKKKAPKIKGTLEPTTTTATKGLQTPTKIGKGIASSSASKLQAPVASKLQAPGSVSSYSQISRPNISSDTKLVKKIGSLITPNTSATKTDQRKSIETPTSTPTKSNVTATSLTTSKIESTSQSTIKSGLATPIKKTSNFGLTKLTKLSQPAKPVTPSKIQQQQEQASQQQTNEMPNCISFSSKLPGATTTNTKSSIGFFGLKPPTSYSTKPTQLTSASHNAFSSPASAAQAESKKPPSPKSIPQKPNNNANNSSAKIQSQVPELELESDQILTIKTYCEISNFDSDSTNSYAEINPKSDGKEPLCLNENFYNSVASESGEDDDDLLERASSTSSGRNNPSTNERNNEASSHNTSNSDARRGTDLNRTMEIISGQQEQLPSPPLPPPPAVPKSFTEMTSCLPSPPPLPPQQQHQSQTRSNFNSFGRSNTLDRRAFTSKNHNSTSFKLSDPKSNIYQNYNSLERKTITDSSSSTENQQTNSYRLFNTLNTTRNSLNLTLKPPSPNRKSPAINVNTNSAQIFARRPLSQDTIQENSACLLDFQQKMSTPTSPDHYNSLAFNNNISNSNLQQHQLSPVQLKQQQQELDTARNQILMLSNQLNNSVQIITSLEQTNSSLSTKLHKTAQSSKRKDAIIFELKAYIDIIHKKYGKLFESDTQLNHHKEQQQQQQYTGGTLNRHNSDESLNSLSSSMFSQQTQATANFNLNNSGSSTSNYSHETDDLTRASSISSPSKKKNWLRSSFRRAFNRKPDEQANKSTSAASKSSTKCLSDVDENDLAKGRLSEFEHFSHLTDYSLPNSPMHQIQLNKKKSRAAAPMPFTIDEDQQLGNDFQKLLRDKEAKLTDIRLEALATAHQLDSQKEENLRLRNEIDQLRMDQIKIQNFLQHQQTKQQSPSAHTTATTTTTTTGTNQSSVCSSLSSPSPSSSIASSSNSKLNLSLSTNHVDQQQQQQQQQSILTPHSINNKQQNNTMNRTSDMCQDGKRVCVTIYLGDTDPLADSNENSQVFIGSLSISTRTNWDTLDKQIKSVFSEYIERLDGNGVPSLGINLNSIASYYVGEMPRTGDDDSNDSRNKPDLLPYGYLVGDHTNIIVRLRSVTAQYQNDIDMLCYETLVQKSRLQCYISLVLDHKSLIFCGPSGTCKSYLARKLGEFLARREDLCVASSVAYLNVENKTSKELKKFLASVVEHENGSEVPHVLILDNLENIGNNSDVFQEFFSAKANSQNKCSYVIGTINQSDVSSLNLHPSFKWILCANHTEPVRSYLNRHLQRRLIDFESKHNIYNQDLEKIVNWLPKAWLHINKYIEQYNSSDLALGPKIFSVVPLDFKQSLNWFIELWNNHLVPFMIETIKEGVQVYGTKMTWEDPKQWIAASFPWTTYDMSLLSSLYSIQPQHVGFDTDTESSSGKMSSSNEDEDKNDKDFDDLDNLNNLNNNLVDAQMTLQSQRPLEGHQFVNNENDKLLNMLIRLQECTGAGGVSSRPVSSISGMQSYLNDSNA